MPVKKATVKKTVKSVAHAAHAAEKYVEAVGRRKRAIARVRIVKGMAAASLVNGRKLAEYFTVPRLRAAALAPLHVLHMMDDVSAQAHVKGGGMRAQAEAVRLGLARALVATDATLKKRLKKLGFMTRDSRAVERKKYGLKKARRAPQWSKR